RRLRGAGLGLGGAGPRQWSPPRAGGRRVAAALSGDGGCGGPGADRADPAGPDVASGDGRAVDAGALPGAALRLSTQEVLVTARHPVRDQEVLVTARHPVRDGGGF